jgi:hypothetical protein
MDKPGVGRVPAGKQIRTAAPCQATAGSMPPGVNAGSGLEILIDHYVGGCWPPGDGRIRPRHRRTGSSAGASTTTSTKPATTARTTRTSAVLPRIGQHQLTGRLHDSECLRLHSCRRIGHDSRALQDHRSPEVRGGQLGRASNDRLLHQRRHARVHGRSRRHIIGGQPVRGLLNLVHPGSLARTGAP